MGSTYISPFSTATAAGNIDPTMSKTQDEDLDKDFPCHHLTHPPTPILGLSLISTGCPLILSVYNVSCQINSALV